MTAVRAEEAAPRAYAALCGTALLLAAALLIYSQTYSFADDEGFHLLAAPLIGRGHRPYLDFFFPQTPLNTYWNAVFGESWRVTHAVATFVVAGSVFLAADHVYRRLPDPAWRLSAAVVTALCFGLNELVVTYGTLAQAYALCLFLVVCAFRCAAEELRGTNLLWVAGAGACASAAAAASLLTAPVAPVLLAWLLWHRHPRGRASRFAAFCAGAVVPQLPMLWLFARARGRCSSTLSSITASFGRSPGRAHPSTISRCIRRGSIRATRSCSGGLRLRLCSWPRKPNAFAPGEGNLSCAPRCGQACWRAQLPERCGISFPAVSLLLPKCLARVLPSRPGGRGRMHSLREGQ